jgi:hypothetical protein
MSLLVRCSPFATEMVQCRDLSKLADSDRNFQWGPTAKIKWALHGRQERQKRNDQNQPHAPIPVRLSPLQEMRGKVRMWISRIRVRAV